METQQKSKQIFITFAALNASFGFFLYFYVPCIYNSIQEALEIYVFPEASITEKSFFASGPFIGGTFGAFLISLIGVKFGRRSLMIWTSVVSIIGTIFTLLPNIPLFIIGRVLTGFEGGVTISLVNIYIAEISEDPLRSQLGIVPNILGAIGTLVAFLLGLLMPSFISNGIPEIGCRLFLGVPAVISLIKIINLIFIFEFETPFYLVGQDKKEEAREVLELLFHDSHSERMEQLQLEKDHVFEEDHVSLKDLLKPKYRKAFLVCIPLSISSSIMGGVVPLVFSNMIFSEGMETSYADISLTLTAVIGILNLLNEFLALIVIKYVGRRTLITVGASLIATINLAITLISFIDSAGNMGVKLLVLLWILVYGLTLGPLGFLYPAEILPEIGVATLGTIGYVVAFITLQLFLPLKVAFGFEGLFLIFTCVAVIGVVIFFLYIIESRNRSKLEMYRLYAGYEEEKQKLIKNM